MPSIKPTKGDQLPIYELLPDVPTTPHKPMKKPFKIEPLYQIKKR